MSEKNLTSALKYLEAALKSVEAYKNDAAVDKLTRAVALLLPKNDAMLSVLEKLSARKLSDSEQRLFFRHVADASALGESGDYPMAARTAVDAIQFASRISEREKETLDYAMHDAMALSPEELERWNAMPGVQYRKEHSDVLRARAARSAASAARGRAARQKRMVRF